MGKSTPLGQNLALAASSRVNAYRTYAAEFGAMGALALGLQRIARRRHIIMPVKGLKGWAHLRSDGSDFLVLRQVIGRRDCLVALTSEPKFIVDAGANVGFTSMLLAEEYPSAVIVAIEPDSSNFLQLCKNCSAYQNVKPVSGGIWHESGSLGITNPSEMSWELRVAAQQNGSIKALTVDDILKRFGQSEIDLLKIDVEGAEMELFQHPTPWLSKVRHLLIELHEHIRPGCTAAFQQAIQKYEMAQSRIGEYEFITFIR